MSLATLRDRVRRKVRRMIEPIAHDLLAWAQGAEPRLARIESHLAGLDDRLNSHDTRLRLHEIHVEELGSHLRDSESHLVNLDDHLSQHEGRLGHLAHGLNVLETRAGEFDSRFAGLDAVRQQAVWERQAIVERLNHDDAREAVLGQKVSSLEHVVLNNILKLENMLDRLAASEIQLDQAYWSRFALVDRLNQIDARDVWRAEILDSKYQNLEESMAEVKLSVETQASLPTASELDSLAMGRRLAALEDEIERLLTSRSDPNDRARGTDLVSFPRSIGGECQKEAG